MTTVECLNGDCLELMKGLPDKSVDLFLCDLPYGCLKTSATECAWDVKIDLVLFWAEVKRLCKNDHTPVLMFGNMRFGTELINSNPSWFRYELVWSKERGTNFLLANKRPMSSHEFIFVFSKKGSFYNRIDIPDETKKADKKKSRVLVNAKTYGKDIIIPPYVKTDNTRCAVSVIEFIRHQVYNRHPTAKPVSLLTWLIERYSNEGDTVLDPTAGSFNSGRAAVELGRNYIGIEMDKEFFDKNKL